MLPRAELVCRGERLCRFVCSPPCHLATTWGAKDWAVGKDLADMALTETTERGTIALHPSILSSNLLGGFLR